MLKIQQVETDEHRCHVRELFWENLSSTNLMIIHEFGISSDVSAILEQDMAKLQQFAPPQGRLLLGEYETKIAGCACLRKIGEDVGEIKRMYVRPEFRRKGIGRSLLQAIIHEAKQIGYSKIRLDTAPFAKAAQALYRSLGFQEIEPYPESEIPEKFRPSWVFMELVIKIYEQYLRQD
ncbi:GCN5-related N-acetyltransferase [Scytonema sp. HK-05]|uniref:GNAT family N-acetyltransferase n=1 Tax=Scytonema sp. HK-05 TaxID=1137095 RepID=UPI000936C924|nr:GNAT family N-acetyltransferase [Scytonema sp. HK-05]OKH60057.1 GNAT family N-acetyltransferase [Scytonema sp. HK-05]BAY42755.1 GCN5-related N-acetyltransferase [Scytonema sp. HK-05]